MHTKSQQHLPRRILRLPEVTHSTGYRRSSIYNFIKEGAFPKAKKLGPRAVGWDSHEIQEWIDARLEGEE